MFSLRFLIVLPVVYITAAACPLPCAAGDDAQEEKDLKPHMMVGEYALRGLRDVSPGFIADEECGYSDADIAAIRDPAQELLMARGVRLADLDWDGFDALLLTEVVCGISERGFIYQVRLHLYETLLFQRNARDFKHFLGRPLSVHGTTWQDSRFGFISTAGGVPPITRYAEIRKSALKLFNAFADDYQRANREKSPPGK